MAQPHSVEVLLRPAVELYTVAVCVGAAVLCLFAPWSLALSPLLGLGGAVAFLAFGTIRFCEAWAILRYRRNIRRIRRYAMASHDIPVSQQRFFVGRSFAATSSRRCSTDSRADSKSGWSSRPSPCRCWPE